MRHITIADILTEREIEVAMTLKGARDICEQIIKPNMGRINRDLGQENDPMYLAYAVEYVISQCRTKE